MLSKYLINAGLVTGPQPSTSNTSNSSMGSAKTFLLGLKQFDGDESYLIFGRVLHDHLQFIENINFRSENFKLLSEQDQDKIICMCEAARSHPVIKKLLIGTIRENKVYTNIDGVRVALILDIEQRNTSTGVDWKSTVCTSSIDFEKKAIMYDYIRQGVLYKRVRNLNHFYFIGIQKNPPFNIYIMDVKRYPTEQLYAKQELKFLLYFYKHYGKIILKGTVSAPTLKTETTTKLINQMAVTTSGKEALKAIEAQQKEVNASAKAHAKNVALLNKMVDKFPKKEKELYTEKLAKYTISPVE